MNRSAFIRQELADFIWETIAELITRSPRLVDWLITRSQRTPYAHITSADGQDVYMRRWWLFNPYPHGGDGEARRWPGLPSVRIHHICRADQDRHHHDHPWNARTIILRGFYWEERDGPHGRHRSLRVPGITARLNFSQYHRISRVSEGGVYTLFICGQTRGTWGFNVDGKKVPWHDYLSSDLRAQPEATQAKPEQA